EGSQPPRVIVFAFQNRQERVMGDQAARETTPLPVDSLENLNSYSIAQAQFDAAAQYVDIPAGLREYLRHTNRLTTVEFPIEEDDGTVTTYTGYRALHSRVRGPGKGGIRYHPEVTAD